MHGGYRAEWVCAEWAYMRGQLTVSGSMGVALKMKAVLGIVGTISKS